jgi:two-component system sensor histidine kinase DesK
MNLRSLPAWLRPDPDSDAAERLRQGKSPWTEAVHLLWSSWIFVVPLFDTDGYNRTWMLLTLLSYPVFLVLYALTILRPRHSRNGYALAIIAMSAVMLKVYPAGISYFVFGCLALRMEGPRMLRRYLGWLLLLNIGFIALAWALGYPWQMMVWLPITVLGTGTVIGVQQLNRQKDAALRLSHEEVRRLAAVAERERIGRDLHDLLGHTLSLVALKSDLAVRLVERDPAAAKREMEDVSTVSRQALAQVRRAVSGIRSAQLAAELASARLMLESDGVHLNYHVDDTPLPPAVETAFALILREAITNVQRHARARHVEVRVTASADVLQLRIHDDGRGGDLVPGNGLDGMRARLQAVGGTLQLDAARGQGTTVTARAPWPALMDQAGDASRQPASVETATAATGLSR